MNARFLGGIGLVAALALSACGAGAEGGGAATGSSAAGGEAGAAVSVAADATGQLKYQETTLTGPAGQEFTVSFSNPAPVQHNWVLVQPGQEDAVATTGAANGGNVAEGTPGVISATPVLNQGQEEDVSVPSTPAGTYSYICTVPGHYQAGMKGTMTLQ